MNDENPVEEAEHTAGAFGEDGVDPRAVGWRKMFSAFRHRNYRVYFNGQLVSLIGNWVNSTAEG